MNNICEDSNNRIPIRIVIIYCAFFYGIWTLVEWYIKPAISISIDNEYLAQLIESGIIKNIVWTVPAWILLCHFDQFAYVKHKQLFKIQGIVSILKYSPIFLGFVLYNIAIDFISHGSVAMSDSFKLTQLIIVLFVGITEEMVFRGWLLNITLKRKGQWTAILINASMFLLIHFPRWIYGGIFISSFINFGFVSVFALSIIFSLSFIKSRNLFIPIALHMCWDLVSFLLY